MDLVATSSLKNDVNILTKLDENGAYKWQLREIHIIVRSSSHFIETRFASVVRLCLNEDGCVCATVVAEFANVSLDILRKGTQNNKGFAKAASELLRPVLSLGEPSEATLGEYLHDLGFRAAARQTRLETVQQLIPIDLFTWTHPPAMSNRPDRRGVPSRGVEPSSPPKTSSKSASWGCSHLSGIHSTSSWSGALTC
eukprot:959263-Pyramimonas_sp.AAC.1